MSRIKLLRNKRDVQLKKMKGELANLLKANQEPSAHLKAEHIYREQNIMAAYEIIELFCQQIADHLPIIEAQKQCPIDLREAVGTIIYAAPRCTDIPELGKLRHYFSAKYGKEFTAIAGELRADCGVNRVVTEKLSTSRPSIELKLNLMKDVAVEYKLDWDPVALKSQLLTPREDLLEGPSQLVGARRTSFRSSSEEPAYSPSKQNQKSAGVEAREERQFIPFVRPTLEAESSLSISQSASQVLTPQKQSSFGHASHGSSVSFHNEDETQAAIERRKSFKNVVFAAHKAAESAERAAAAARAAIAIAGQNLDETGSSTDNESGDEASQSSHYESRTNLPFIEADEGRELYSKQYQLQQGGHLEHSASPSVLSIERFADDDDDDDRCGSDSVSPSTFMPGRHGKNRASSQGINNRVSTSQSVGYQEHNTSSHKRNHETSRAAPIFDSDEWDDSNNENAVETASSIGTGPRVRAPPRLPEGQTPSLTKSTFAHPKLPDCDEFVAHFRALKAINAKQ
ncbi:hypothetical protein GOP47_0001806 [Adiantum capillus-veneris]|uniref:Regulator of Vps4 activity in the MVB pathway protein n=1 Tax=Adiantum capillus-veneris TaxID=13818 RepID=A0A9D4V9E3_ADICA|nr:hypothetical protein GOP47_0001806 [Adiantum capillus-veneris]